MKAFLLFLFVFLAACAAPQIPDLMSAGQYKIYATVVVTEDWCYMPDNTRVNGVTRYNQVVRSVSEICVSLKSDDPQRTLQHELEHAWRNAVGTDVLWAGHRVHCTGPNC